MSSAARCATFHASSVPPAPTAAGVAPPAASTVVIIASAEPNSSIRSSSAVRRDAQNTGNGLPPAFSIASHSASM